MNRKPIFDAVRKLLGRSFTQDEVEALDEAIDMATGGLSASLAPESPTGSATSPAVTGRTLGKAGADLIKKWEGCAKRLANGNFTAYADPGSIDGEPWTIGWGSTGPDVTRGVIFTQAQCDERFDQDILHYVEAVDDFLGTSATTQNQFDALVSFHYNTGQIRKSTLAKLHKKGDFEGAEKEFARWIFNDGKPMNGLKNRRAEEAELYSAR
ncbi:glycoside hydrolase family protein [Novosphingobium sp. FGD1]|uniref:Lysozyme n=1 Tax=Novosphingobium silvae TaxID=2692619 RepID=A0A7X4GDM0_9SPHN|nr:lysozyme [Novosphingobium silvae]MYL96316.1 glycoside hydrolase family protein [Novosphingobium silvae]